MANDFIVPDRRGLVAEYLLNGDTKDTSGNGYNGTASNVTYSKTSRGYQTYAGNFNGSSSYVSMGDVLDFEYNQPFSISVVLKNSMTWGCNIVSKQENGWAYHWYGLWTASDWTLQFFLYAGGWSGALIVNFPSSYNDGKQHKVDCTYDGSNTVAGIKLYVDGSQVSWTVINNFPFSVSLLTAASFQISGRGWAANLFNGSIQSVRIFNRALSETESRNWYLESLRALGGSSLAWLMDGLVAQINTADGNELSDIVWGVAVTKTSGTATTDNLGYARAITNPNYAWPSITYTTWYAFENAGSGWVLTQTPSGLSATWINRTTTLREIFLFNRTLSAGEKNALETLCKLDYVLPFDGSIRYSLPPQLKEGCVLFIPWDVSGTTAYDASGNSNHGTLVNSPTKTRGGLLGYKGLKFNGTSQYAAVPSSLWVSWTACSLSAVVKLNSEISSWFYCIASQSSASAQVTNAILYEYNGGTRRLWFYRSKHGVGDQFFQYNIALGTSNSYALTYSYDWTTIRGYVNGVPVWSVAASGNWVSSTYINETTLADYQSHSIKSPQTASNFAVHNVWISEWLANMYAKSFFIP